MGDAEGVADDFNRLLQPGHADRAVGIGVGLACEPEPRPGDDDGQYGDDSQEDKQRFQPP